MLLSALHSITLGNEAVKTTFRNYDFGLILIFQFSHKPYLSNAVTMRRKSSIRLPFAKTDQRLPGSAALEGEQNVTVVLIFIVWEAYKFLECLS